MIVTGRGVKPIGLENALFILPRTMRPAFLAQSEHTAEIDKESVHGHAEHQDISASGLRVAVGAKVEVLQPKLSKAESGPRC